MTARAIGINHVALEVGDVEEALAFYGRLFSFELRGRTPGMAFIDLGDQFIALSEGRRQPRDDPADWVADVLPALVQNGAPVCAHELSGRWSDIASPAGLLRANFDVIEGRLNLPVDGIELDEGLMLGDGSSLDGVAMVEPPVWIGADVEIGEHARLQGPLVIGDGAAIGDGAQLRSSVIFPGSTVPRETILIGAIAGHTGIVEALSPLG